MNPIQVKKSSESDGNGSRPIENAATELSEALTVQLEKQMVSLEFQLAQKLCKRISSIEANSRHRDILF